MPNDLLHITPANLSWDNAGNPYSEEYQDIYYSKADALAESTYTFLEANNLTERWKKLNGDDFVIGECGFGGGLNFLNTCKLWCKIKPKNSTLFYLASELRPFTLEDLVRLHKQHLSLLSYAEVFQQHYPPHTPGVHCIELNLKNCLVVLILMLGDAGNMLKQVWQPNGFRVDSWYLDGFSPAVNPDMWDEDLCSIIAKLSKAGTTLSTYSAAGLIKRALRKHNFSIERKSGFSQKRHMLTAEYHPANEKQKPIQQKCFQLPEPNHTDKRAIVIGGGLAGCSTASELAKSGWKITLIEREPSIANKASGNPRGIVYCKITDGKDVNADYYLNSYVFALQHYQNVSKTHSIDWQTCGLIQLAHDEREQKRQAQSIKNLKDANLIQYLDAQAASQLSGIKLDKGGLFFPSGGFLNPQALCQAYIQHDNIKCITNTEALNLSFEKNLWFVEDNKKNLLKAPIVIIANSHDALSFKQTEHYPLLMNYGQIDEYHETRMSKTLSCIICAKGYISPANGKSHFIGGVTKTTEPALNDTSDLIQQNLELTHSISPELMEELRKMGPTNVHYGSRCSSPDYLPITGPVENKRNCQRIYKKLYHNAKKIVSQTPDYEPGLYINVAHGSHGLTSTPIIANYLTKLINHTPLPLSNSSINSMHPIRYLIRDLKKQRL